MQDGCAHHLGGVAPHQEARLVVVRLDVLGLELCDVVHPGLLLGLLRADRRALATRRRARAVANVVVGAHPRAALPLELALARLDQLPADVAGLCRRLARPRRPRRPFAWRAFEGDHTILDLDKPRALRRRGLHALHAFQTLHASARSGVGRRRERRRRHEPQRSLHGHGATGRLVRKDGHVHGVVFRRGFARAQQTGRVGCRGPGRGDALAIIEGGRAAPPGACGVAAPSNGRHVSGGTLVGVAASSAWNAHARFHPLSAARLLRPPEAHARCLALSGRVLLRSNTLR